MPAFFKGGPHIHTFDGLDYPFSSQGEFTLVNASGDLTIQGRMEEVDNTSGSTFTAFAAKGQNSSFQVEIDPVTKGNLPYFVLN